MKPDFNSKNRVNQNAEAVQKMEIYLNQAKAIAALKQKTGAPTVTSFKPFLSLLQGFLHLHSINFEIPELRERRRKINSLEIEPFVNRFSGFIEEVRSTSTL